MTWLVLCGKFKLLENENDATDQKKKIHFIVFKEKMEDLNNEDVLNEETTSLVFCMRTFDIVSLCVNPVTFFSSEHLKT